MAPTQELTDWLANHNIRILGTRDYNPDGTTRLMYLVSCPWESEHTESFGAKDTAVWVDPETGNMGFQLLSRPLLRTWLGRLSGRSRT